MAFKRDRFRRLGLSDKPNKQKVLLALNIILFIAIFFISFNFLEINFFDFITSPIPMISFLFLNFFPPNFNNLPQYLPVVFESVFFAFAATYLASFFAFILALFASARLNKNSMLRMFSRGVVAFLRNIPVLIWAWLLIFVFGSGNMVGLMALTLSSIGFLARSYAESFDDILGDKIEAIEATGASYSQILLHGIIPEFIPSWINWTLYLFELNIRISAILGVVGAGGIGTIIQIQLMLRNFQEASTLIICLILLVLLTEFAVAKIRNKFM